MLQKAKLQTEFDHLPTGSSLGSVKYERLDYSQPVRESVSICQIDALHDKQRMVQLFYAINLTVAE